MLKLKISSLFKSKRIEKTVTFATCCWEKDWKEILLSKDYLKKQQIENNRHAFKEKIVIINNVSDYPAVIQAAKKKVEEGVITGFYLSKEHAEKALEFFQLKKEDFKKDKNLKISDDWVYYNALGPLCAIYLCKTDYLLYLTGDSRLKTPINWIEKAIEQLEKKSSYKVANLTWNENYAEAKKESFKETQDFYISKKGFSDQLFLIPVKDFQKPIYYSLRKDSAHFPWGDIFEKRVFSYMRDKKWKRITYKLGSYHHENF